jgi:putative oxidoreductase
VAATGSWIQDLLYTLLRSVSGLCLGVHGAQKLFGLFGGTRAGTWSQLWVGGLIELVCGLAVALGLSRWAALLVSGTMAVAYVQFHWKLVWGLHMVPVVNKGELALVYCLLFAYFAAKGSGRWSLSAS